MTSQYGILQKQYRNSLIKEIVRKSIHLCSAFVPTFLGIAYYPAIGALCALGALYCVSEVLRLRGISLPGIARITEVAARKRDENRFVRGPVTLVLGILCAAVFLPPQAARIGIYALAFGDGLASLCGRLFGRVHIPFTNGKTAAGSLACFFAVFLSSFCVCRNTQASLALAAAAMLVEIIPMTDFDNIVIPIAVGSLARLLLG
ncbi:MAG: phosphatidate cytidylyltransferase [Treponemataceae bacterium]|nr:phosphatidate cytidylyltransferase [Treponemataceae bacterium]